ncbi:hypothetical protein CWB96_18395 [Pseudoalteromonas citrea]|uniref:Uncharacterized protein n=1 Tax=Pseudoalteromonas citrea TaxID=43655 RepID=A0A5S3XLX7_9GAMM|nr:hypothetical protein CWB97_17075 [Pseudoalteromonas citrea]TMP54908.1 hypothetical protein CWB96_18395 [Pseudoalteromonas citrea]
MMTIYSIVLSKAMVIKLIFLMSMYCQAKIPLIPLMYVVLLFVIRLRYDRALEFLGTKTKVHVIYTLAL